MFILTKQHTAAGVDAVKIFLVMQKDDIMYLAVYPNGEYTTNADFVCTSKDPQARFYLKQICKASYVYGNHLDFQIIDRTGSPDILTIGNFDMLKFYTHGIRDNFCLTVELKDKRSGNLYIHDISSWQDPVKDSLEFLKKVNDCGNYEIYILRQENDALRAEIERLKKQIK